MEEKNETLKVANFKGFAVGDPCMGVETTICGNLGLAADSGVDFWGLLFLAGHGQIPLQTFHQVLKACMPHDHDDHSSMATLLATALQQATAATSGIVNGDDYNKVRNSNLRINTHDTICKQALDKMKRQAGGFFVYSLYDDCTYSNPFSSNDQLHLQGGLNDYPCGTEKVMAQYLALPEVQKALHVRSDFFEVDNAVGFDYTPTYKDVSDIYRQANAANLKVLVYNGDTDPAITMFGVQNWTTHLGFKETSDWRPWTVDGCRRMGGYGMLSSCICIRILRPPSPPNIIVLLLLLLLFLLDPPCAICTVTRYEGNFDFLTIRGSG
jgi:Serine carboxypeptidase